MVYFACSHGGCTKMPIVHYFLGVREVGQTTLLLRNSVPSFTALDDSVRNTIDILADQTVVQEGFTPYVELANQQDGEITMR